jgi:WD40 repeat protein
VHRDIKPSNVVFVGGVPKLADIGLVAAISDAQTFIGTEGFVPPEGPGAPSADVYALGKVLYEVSTGQDRSEFPRLPGNLSELPDRAQLLELNEVVIRACDPDATLRHQDASALLSELLLLQAGRSIRRLRLAERSLGRALRAAVFLGVVAVVAGTGAWIERARLASETVRRQAAEAALADLARKTYYSASLARAQRAIEVGDYGSARRILQALVPRDRREDLRGFEWGALWNEASGDRADVLRVDGAPFRKLSLSDDGKLIAGQSADDRTTLWDTAALQPVRTIVGTHRLAGFSSDGKWLLGGNPSFELERWSVASGEGDPVQETEALHYVVGRSGKDSVLGLIVHKDLSLVALREWNSAEHKDDVRVPPVLADLDSWKYETVSSISPANERVAMVFFNRHPGTPSDWLLQVYDLRDLRLVREEHLKHPVAALGLSHVSGILAISLEDTNEITAEEADTGATLWRSVTDSNGTTSLAFSSDDRMLAISGSNTLIHVVSAQTGQPINDLRGQDGAVQDMIWSNSDGVLYSAGSGGELRRWTSPSVPSRKLVTCPGLAARLYHCACISDDGSLFAATADADHILLGSTGAGRQHDDINVQASIPLGFDHGDAEFLALDPQGHILRWQVSAAEDPRIESTLPLGNAVATCGSISGDRRRLVAGDSAGNLQFWDLGEKKLLSTQPAHHGYIWWAFISSSGKIAVTSGDNQEVKVWSVETGQLLTTWNEKARPLNAAISRDGLCLAVCCADGEVELRNLRTFVTMRRWQTDSSVLRAAAFSNDNSRLFCGGANGIVSVYDMLDWRQIGVLDASSEKSKSDPTVTFLSMSANSSALLAYSENGVVRFWHDAR